MQANAEMKPGPPAQKRAHAAYQKSRQVQRFCSTCSYRLERRLGELLSDPAAKAIAKPIQGIRIRRS